MSQGFKNWLENTEFVVVFLLILIGLPIFIAKKHFLGIQDEFLNDLTVLRGLIGFAALLIAIFVAVFNVRCSYSSFQNKKHEDGYIDDYQNVSGLVVISSIMILITAVVLPVSYWVGIVCLVVFFTDTHGIPWSAGYFIREYISEIK